MLAKPIAKKRVRNRLVMRASVNKLRDYSQRISQRATHFLCKKRANRYNFAFRNARNSRASAEAKI